MSTKKIVEVNDPYRPGKKMKIEVEHITPPRRTIAVEVTQQERLINVPEYYRDRAKRNSESD